MTRNSTRFVGQTRLLGGLAFCVVLGGVGGCASPTTQTPPSRAGTAEDPEALPAPPPSPRPQGTANTSADWSVAVHRKLVLRPQNLVLSLPDGDRWEPQKRRGTWSGLRHAATDSEVWVRHVPARRTVTVEECEREARLSWSLLRDDARAADERPLHAPEGYSGKTVIRLSSDGGGRAEAYSVGVSRCLAVVFTMGAHPGFPQRLSAAVNGVLPGLRVPSIGERGLERRSGPSLPAH